MSLLTTPLLHLPTARVRGALGLSAVIVLAVAAISYFPFGFSVPLKRGNDDASSPPPATPPPLLLRDVDQGSALRINANIPLSGGPNPPARPFKVEGNAGAYDRSLQCLTEAIYYEAGSEQPDGQRAVAQVVLNRVRHPAFGQSVCAAVYHGSMRTTGCQFSFTCDGSMRRRPSTAGWARAREIAAKAIAGAVFKPVGYATHYHADYVVPYWATSLAKNAVLGTHIFYRWPGWWGKPAAFANRHSGKETDPRLLRNAALRRYGIRPELASWSDKDLVLAVDSRVELISIIQLLATRPEPGQDPTTYEKEVRRHFSAYSSHVAVEIYRQLSARNSKFNAKSSLATIMHYSEPPKLTSRLPIEGELTSAAGGKRKLDGFISALRDFVRHSDFETFLKERKLHYAEKAAEVRGSTFALVVATEQDTGIPVHTIRFIVAPLLGNSGPAACQALPKGKWDAWVVIGLDDALGRPLDRPAQLKDALASLSESDCLSRSRAAISANDVPPPRGN